MSRLRITAATITAAVYLTAPATLDRYWPALGGELQDYRCVVG